MNDAPQVQMPMYKCHKEVWALKIKDVASQDPADAGWKVIPEDGAYAPIVVSDEWVQKHQPRVGGYYVVYKDGYVSFSPAEAFEDGYTKV